MSLPRFPVNEQVPSREEVINQIISSIAMEELGLSHVINTEGEKLQYAFGTIPGVSGPAEPLTIDELLELNDSVRKTLDSTMMNQFFLKEKLHSALNASVMQGPTGPAGPTGQAGPFLSSYAEALMDTQTVAGGSAIVFDTESIDSVGGNITLDSSGTVFTITRPGLYQVSWNINIDRPAGSGAVVGVLENGEPASGTASTVEGNFSSGTVFSVDTVPFTVSLINYNDEISISRPDGWDNSAGSIRIIRFADGQSS